MPRRAYTLVIEKGTVLKWILIIAYLVLNGFLFYRTYKEFETEPYYAYIHRILGSSVCVSRGAADIILLNAGILLLPMSRFITTVIRNMNNKISRRTFRNFLDAGKKIHMYCVYLMILATAIHVGGHLINASKYSINYMNGYKNLNAASHKGQDPLWIVLPTVPGATGIAMVIILCVIYSGSRRSVRHSNYPLFHATHKLFLLFYALLLVHGFRGILRKQTNVLAHAPECMDRKVIIERSIDNSANLTRSCLEPPTFVPIEPKTHLWLAAPLLICFLDLIIRLVRRSKPHQVTGIRNIGSDIIKVFIKTKKMKIKPGQYMFISIPKLSTSEWHPFSIVDNEKYDKDHNEISFYINTVGHWTGSLKQLAQNRYDVEGQQNPVLQLTARLDGPFGSPLGDVLTYQVSVCVAGGVGITPFLSYVNYIRRKNLYFKKTQILHILWSSRNMNHFEEGKRALEDLTNALVCTGKDHMFQVEFYLTGEKNHNTLSVDPYVSKRLQYGRVDWIPYMSTLSKAHSKCNIGVFTCASRAVNSAVQSACEKFDNVIFNKENF